MKIAKTLALAAPFLIASCRGSQMARGIPLGDAPGANTRYQPPSTLPVPTTAWREDAPESQGVSSRALAEAIESARAKGMAIHELLVIRRGTVILDAAFYPFARGARHDIASITKSVTSMVAGIALGGGGLGPETDVVRLLGGSGAPVTIQQLLAMRSGFDCGFGRGEVELEAMKQSSDWVRFSLDMPRRSTAGTEFGYCSPNYHIVSAALTRATGLAEAEFAGRELFEPLGIGKFNWPADAKGLSHGWGDLQLSPRDLAKLGLLMLHDGAWGEERILPDGWVGFTTTPRVQYGANNLYGLGWWSHTDSPKGLFEAIGRGGQRLTIWPEKELVVVMLGGGFDPSAIAPFLMKSLIADSAIAPDAEGLTALQRAVLAASQPPAADPMTTSPKAALVSGTTWSISSNPLGLLQARFIFADSSATVTLKLRDRQLQLPIGLDGRYLLAPDAVDGIQPGTRGRWLTDSTFRLEFDLIGKVDHFTLTVTFHGRDDATIELVERTGLMRQVLNAKAVK